MRMRIKQSETDQANLTFTFTVIVPHHPLEHISGNVHEDSGFSSNNSFGARGDEEGFRVIGNNKGFPGGCDDKGLCVIDNKKQH